MTSWQEAYVETVSCLRRQAKRMAQIAQHLSAIADIREAIDFERDAALTLDAVFSGEFTFPIRAAGPGAGTEPKDDERSTKEADSGKV